MIMIKHGPLTLKLYDYDPHVLLENITLTAQCCDIYSPGDIWANMITKNDCKKFDRLQSLNINVWQNLSNTSCSK